MMNKTTVAPQITWLHGAVAGSGLLVLVLLFFADKTNLNNDPGGITAGQVETPPPKGSKGGLLDLIAPLEGLQGWDSVRIELVKATGGPDEADKLKSTVAFLRDQGRLDAAAVYAERLANLEPGAKNWLVAGALTREAAVSTAGINSDESRFSQFIDTSISLLEKALEEEPENQDALIELGLAYIGSGKPEFSMQGIQQLLKVMELNPDNGEAAFHLGMFSRQTGQWDKAASRFETVVRVDPQNYSAKYFLAVTYLDMGKNQEAEALLQEVINGSQEAELIQAAKEIKEKI